MGYFLCLLLRTDEPDQAARVNLQDLSVIIPFRNESENMEALLRSLTGQEILPKEILFVNDHSEDDFLPIFETSTFKILHLEAGFQGKKAAIKAGVSQAKGNFILTLDADVQLQTAYFRELAQLPAADLLILPVRMKSRNLLGVFAALDFYFLNALNVALSGIGKPIVANGANLLFRREVYREMLAGPDSAQIASGDDMFLLKAAKEQKRKIRVLTDEILAVETTAPTSLTGFLHQRLRWVGKTKHVQDTFANFIGFLGIVYHFSAIPVMILEPQLWWIYAVKMLCDLLVLLPHLFRLKHVFLGCLSPVFTLLYPFYLLFLFFAVLIVHPIWKGRAVGQ